MRRKIGQGVALWLLATSAAAEDWRATYTLYGTPGLIEMPSAVSPADGELATTLGGFSSQQRGTVTFQVFERLTGSFRYSRIEENRGPGTPTTYDRSFDLQYRLLDETAGGPAVAIGLRDFIGTGKYSSEYVVATKTFGDAVRVSAGIGWGRLGSYNGFTNPLGVIDEGFETRPDRNSDPGGTVNSYQWFRGDAALFGGVEWRVTPETVVMLEYSSDAYERETGNGTLERASPINLGVAWSPQPGYQLGAYALHGNEIGVSASFVLNPAERPVTSGFDTAPIPVAVRDGDARAAQSWDRQAVPEPAVQGALQQAMAIEGLILNGVEFGDRAVRIRYTNERYRSEAQGLGRTARILTQALPPSVETFVLEPQQAGIPMSSVTLRRSDMELLENEPDSAWRSYVRASFDDAGGTGGLTEVADPRPAFTWGIAPYAEITLFDGDNPAQGDFGLEFSASYQFQPNLVLSGAVRKRLVGNRDEPGSISDSTLPPVRRNTSLYAAEGDPGLEYLTLAWYGRPGPDLYSRVTVGYLERMFGGVSGEVLWKPVDSRLALGAELNYVAQRDYDLGFGFQDYDVVTGHASAYYDFGNGYHGQVDVGRYLAGDWGATFALDREFDNGWKVGAYFTLTDVPFEDFGEGSFDKGIRVTIPVDWVLGQPTRQEVSTTLTSLARDGGARLQVDGRLYEVVRDGHQPELADGWGRFWR